MNNDSATSAALSEKGAINMYEVYAYVEFMLRFAGLWVRRACCESHVRPFLSVFNMQLHDLSVGAARAWLAVGKLSQSIPAGLFGLIPSQFAWLQSFRQLPPPRPPTMPLKPGPQTLRCEPSPH